MLILYLNPISHSLLLRKLKLHELICCLNRKVGSEIRVLKMKLCFNSICSIKLYNDREKEGKKQERRRIREIQVYNGKEMVRRAIQMIEKG